MKATIKFNLDDESDKVSYLQCTKAKDMAHSLWDIDQHLRGKTKYAPDSMPQEVYDALVKVREDIREILNSYNIDLDELVK